jgi:hypothetical protein
MMPAAGVSWRVGVVQPLDPNLDLEALGEIGRNMVAASQEVSFDQASNLAWSRRGSGGLSLHAQHGCDVHGMIIHSKGQQGRKKLSRKP